MKSKVLLVDDITYDIDSEKDVLEENGLELNAVTSGEKMLEYVKDNEPDLILLDIQMPEMDGIESYKRLREIEKEKGYKKIPVIFLTSEDDSDVEQLCLEMGADDYIERPFKQDVILRRVKNIIEKNKTIESLTEKATYDKLTGFLNKASTDEKMIEVCQTEKGFLAVMDMDNFKLINDLYGHDMGDKALVKFADLLRSNTRTEDILCRIGGDEFLVFFKNLTDDAVITKLTKRLNQQFLQGLKELMGSDFDIDIGISVGCVPFPEQGRNYELLFQLADKALYYIKKNGKNGCGIYNPAYSGESEEDPYKELARITQIVEERGSMDGALWLDRDSFVWAYRLLVRVMRRNRGVVMKFLFTLSLKDEADEEDFLDALDKFGRTLQGNLRKSDIMMQYKKKHFFLILPKLLDDSVTDVIERTMKMWRMEKYADKVNVEYVREKMDFR